MIQKLQFWLVLHPSVLIGEQQSLRLATISVSIYGGCKWVHVSRHVHLLSSSLKSSWEKGCKFTWMGQMDCCGDYT